MSERKKLKEVDSKPSLSRTVTFLFTDIEGSTKLWEAQPESMRVALARHDALLRRCIETNQGQVFKTVGDAFCAVFASATDAVGAAFAAQQALHAERWPEHVAIRARMAVHTGAAELRDGDYFGPPLNHVARLLAVGHGGQTLLSQVTHDLCGDQLPVGAAMMPLGEHQLKDLARREAVFQLCHPNLPQAFPPLKTLRAFIDETIPSIAVLPFTDLSPQKDQEYFTDGLAEELLNVLTKIRGLRVASRTSAFHFKGKDVDIPTIAQELNVATILEGSVRKSGKRVRITAQLIEVATDSHLWSQTYDRELEDIFAVQDDIAQAVVTELRAALLGEKPAAAANAEAKAEVQAASKGRGANVEAYQLYLQGRFLIDRQTREDRPKGIAYLRRAVELDPENALAWAGLSIAYSNQSGTNWAQFMGGVEPARETAQEALRLEPHLAEGHLALGIVANLFDWDWKGADTAFRRALELVPGSAQILQHAGALAGNLGRIDEALTLHRMAAALDPLSAPTHRSFGKWSLLAGRLEEAVAALEKARELNPPGEYTRYWLGLVRLMQGRVDEAQETFEGETHATLRLLGLTLTHHAQVRPSESNEALRQLIALDADGGAYQIADAYAYRGEEQLAFEWLERAYTHRDPGLAFMRADVLLRNLHKDARWQPFLEKMRLAD